jgi:RecA-family ATPase
VRIYTSTGANPAALPDTLPKSVEAYLSVGASEGSRNRTLFGIACQLRDIGKSAPEAASILTARAMADGLPEWEIGEVFGKVFSRPARELPTGAIASNGRRVGGDQGPMVKAAGAYTMHKRGGAPTRREGRTGGSAMDRATPIPPPRPLEDGVRAVLMAAFHEGEGVCIAGTRDGQPERGAALTREEWIERIDRKGGIDRCFTGADGLFLRVNPIQPRSKCNNEDVTDFRHVLVEFDNDENGVPIPKDRQFGMFLASNLPITCVIDSGNKSLHAWVRVDAMNAAEYATRAAEAYAVFTDSHEGLDGGNHNPNRFSRCPDGWRTERGQVLRQSVIHLRMGASSWAEWEGHREAATLGTPLRFSELLAYPVKDDPNNLIGNRWICRGGSLVIVSQSGVGKSSIMAQLSHGWALARTDMTFGIKPVKPLRQLIIQAENDIGDIAEAVQAVSHAFDLHESAAELSDRIEWRRISTITGAAFLDTLSGLVKLLKPDVVWIDPLLSYIGDDIKEQSVISQFCGEGLNAISIDTGVVFAIVHHTGKPTSAESKRGRTATDLAYSGIGSSSLTNWAREVLVLDRVAAPEGHPATFSLTATKRRTRAGMRSMTVGEDGERKITEQIYVRHATDGTIHWEQCEEPPAPAAKSRASEPGGSDGGGGRYRRGKATDATGNAPHRPSTFDAAAQLKLADFLATHAGGDVRNVTGEKLNALCRYLEKSPPTVRKWLSEFGAARDAAESAGAI